MQQTKKKLTIRQRTLILLALGVLLTLIAVKTSRQSILASLSEPASWLLVYLPICMCFTKKGDTHKYFRTHYKPAFLTVLLFTIPIYCLNVSIIFNCGHADNACARMASAIAAFFVTFSLEFLGTPLCFKFLKQDDAYKRYDEEWKLRKLEAKTAASEPTPVENDME